VHTEVAAGIRYPITENPPSQPLQSAPKEDFFVRRTLCLIQREHEAPVINRPKALLIAVKALLTISRPLQVHSLIVLLDKFLNLVDFTIIEDATVLQNSVAIVFHKKFGGAGFGQLSVAGMDVHTLDDAVGCKIQIIIGKANYLNQMNGFA
jgi:hypothetical protein